jgi:hypothetical protein
MTEIPGAASAMCCSVSAAVGARAAGPAVQRRDEEAG